MAPRGKFAASPVASLAGSSFPSTKASFVMMEPEMWAIDHQSTNLSPTILQYLAMIHFVSFCHPGFTLLFSYWCWNHQGKNQTYRPPPKMDGLQPGALYRIRNSSPLSNLTSNKSSPSSGWIPPSSSNTVALLDVPSTLATAMRSPAATEKPYLRYSGWNATILAGCKWNWLYKTTCDPGQIKIRMPEEDWPQHEGTLSVLKVSAMQAGKLTMFGSCYRGASYQTLPWKCFHLPNLPHKSL